MSFRRIVPKPAGFTLVELLIVVIIIAILAAVVVPQFSDTGNQAREAALDANLATMRSAIELYQQQHGAFPGRNASTGGAANSAQAFTEQMTLFSNAAGLTSATRDNTNFRFGPYLRRGVPVEQVSQSAAIEIVTAGTLNMTANTTPAAGPGGWRYDPITGQLIANTVALQGR